MARNFNGTSDDLTLGSAVLSALPCTLAGWCRSALTADADTLISIGSSSTDTPFIQILIAQTIVQAQSRDDAGQLDNSCSGTHGWSANTWHHIAGTFAASAREVFGDGSSIKSTATPSQGAFTLNQTGLGVTFRTGKTNHVDGDLAECAVWNVILSNAEIVAHAAGLSAALIRPWALVGYWKVLGRSSPEVEYLSGANSMTVAGATVAEHPRIIYPSAPQIITAPAAAGDPEGPLIGGKLIRGGILGRGRLVA